MGYILTFFVAHWIISVFFQSFFLHRYSAHKMFTLNRFWEKVFHFLTIAAQGPSYLNPYGYAILHRMHHAYSDTEKDPHSPVTVPNLFKMMWKTKTQYDGYTYGTVEPEARFKGDTPEWPIVDKIAKSWFFRIGFGALYLVFYIAFVPEGMWYLYALLPLHWLMGPIHGSIVNWCGHMYGYTNYKKTRDNSKNTLIFDFLTMGELFQNNHHGAGANPNFARKWFEIDPTYAIMKVFHWMHIIRIKDVPDEAEALAAA